jgi:hypothetical protein
MKFKRKLKKLKGELKNIKKLNNNNKKTILINIILWVWLR